jgi:hypothetical protein
VISATAAPAGPNYFIRRDRLYELSAGIVVSATRRARLPLQEANAIRAEAVHRIASRDATLDAPCLYTYAFNVAREFAREARRSVATGPLEDDVYESITSHRPSAHETIATAEVIRWLLAQTKTLTPKQAEVLRVLFDFAGEPDPEAWATIGLSHESGTRAAHRLRTKLRTAFQRDFGVPPREFL